MLQTEKILRTKVLTRPKGQIESQGGYNVMNRGGKWWKMRLEKAGALSPGWENELELISNCNGNS